MKKKGFDKTATTYRLSLKKLPFKTSFSSQLKDNDDINRNVMSGLPYITNAFTFYSSF